MTPVSLSERGASVMRRPVAVRTVRAPSPNSDSALGWILVVVGVGGLVWSKLGFPYGGAAFLSGGLALAAGGGILAPGIAAVVLGGSIGHSAFVLVPFGLPYSGTMFVILMAAAMGAPLLVRIAAKQGFQIQRSPVPVFAFALGVPLLLAAWLFAGTLWTLPGEVFSLYGIANIGSGIGVWLWIALTTQDLRATRRQAAAGFIGVNVLALVANSITETGNPFAFIIAGSGFWTATTSTRESFGGFNEITVAVEFLAPIAIGLGAAIVLPGQRLFKRVAFALAALIVIQLMVQTGTRQAFVAFLVSGVVMAAYAAAARRGREKAATMLLVTTAFIGISYAALWWSGSSGERVRETVEAGVEESGIDERWQFALADIEDIAASPVLGYGVGYTSPNNFLARPLSHNLFTSLWLELGIAGPLLLLWLFLSVARAIVRRSRDREAQWANMALVGLFVFFVLTTMASGRVSGGFPFFAPGVLLATGGVGRWRRARPGKPSPVARSPITR